MADICGCGRPITPFNPDTDMSKSAGWCAPSEILYGLPKIDQCSDCNTRMLMIMELGIDPGPDGENLVVPRGGIKYGGM